MVKILLISPLQSMHEQFGKYKDGGGNNIPIGLLSLATYLRHKSFAAEIFDAAPEQVFTPSELVLRLKNIDFDIVGIQCFTNTMPNTSQTLAICRENFPDKLILVGGVHPTVLPENTLKELALADGLIMGEGEYPVEKIMYNISRGLPFYTDVPNLLYRQRGGHTISRTNEKCPRFDVNAYDYFDYDLIKLALYRPHIINYKRLPSIALYASRGCPFNCSFCSARFVNGVKPRYRDLGNVIKEIRFLVTHKGIRDILFQDSTLMTNRGWVEEFCREMIRGKLDITFSACSRVDQIDPDLLKLLRRAGFWRLSFGIESYNAESLKLINKNVTVEQNKQAIMWTREAGMQVDATHIIGLPGEDYHAAWNTVTTARKIGTEYALFFLPVPYPKTKLYEMCKSDGGLRENSNWEGYGSIDFSNPVYVNPLIPIEEYKRLPDRAHRYYYSSPKVVMRHLRSIRSFSDVKKYYHAVRGVFL